MNVITSSKKTYTKLKEAQLNHTLLKPYLEICSAFDLTQLINKPTRSTLKTSSLLDNILTNSKESVTQHCVIILGIWDHDFIFCTEEIKYFKLRKHSTISVRAYKNYSQKLLQERLHKWLVFHLQYHCIVLWLIRLTKRLKMGWSLRPKLLENIWFSRKIKISCTFLHLIVPRLVLKYFFSFNCNKTFSLRYSLTDPKLCMVYPSS